MKSFHKIKFQIEKIYKKKRKNNNNNNKNKIKKKKIDW